MERRSRLASYLRVALQHTRIVGSYLFEAKPPTNLRFTTVGLVELKHDGRVHRKKSVPATLLDIAHPTLKIGMGENCTAVKGDPAPFVSRKQGLWLQDVALKCEPVGLHLLR